MNQLKEFIQHVYIKYRISVNRANVLLKEERGEFALSTIVGVAIGLIVAAFVLIPGIQSFAEVVMDDMQDWWSDSVGAHIFPD